MPQRSIILNNVTKKYEDNVVLNSITLSIQMKDRIGIIGENGSGKSTLLKLLIGNIQPDTGRVIRNNITIGFVQQDTNIAKSGSLFEYFSQNQTSDSSWYKYLGELELEDKLSTPLRNLSGGEYMKAQLLNALAKKPGILILDEPTNHLDIYTNIWLEKYLHSWKGGLVVVSHNRDFLNAVTTKTIEVHEGQLSVYGGNYDFYVAQKKQSIESQQREMIRLQKDAKKAKVLVQKELKRAAHSSRKDISRNPDDHDRLQAGFMKEHAEKAAGKNKTKGQQKVKEIQEKIEASPFQKLRKIDARISVQAEPYAGKTLYWCENLVCGYKSNPEILFIPKFSLAANERVALFGKNGSGKSTFLHTIARMKSIMVKGRQKRHRSMIITVIDQNYEIVDKNKTVLENAKIHSKNHEISYIRKYLDNFLFSESKIHQKVSKMSGGEIARLAVAVALLSPLDLLILDEPTNNLDIPAIEEFSSALSLFRGSVVAVSHDLKFLKDINIERSFLIQNRELLEMRTNPKDGNYFSSELFKNMR